MNVVFTDHALRRCGRRGINPRRVERDIETLPDFTGTLEWRFRFYNVVLQKIGDTVLVVTVYRRNRRRKGA